MVPLNKIYHGLFKLININFISTYIFDFKYIKVWVYTLDCDHPIIFKKYFLVLTWIYTMCILYN
jgi:hypothetical protein